LWPLQHAAYARFVRRPAHLKGEYILAKQATLTSDIRPADLTDTLRRASAAGDIRRVPDQLKAVGVDVLRFSSASDGDFQLIPVGLESRGSRAPSVRLQVTLRVLAGSSHSAIVQLEVRPTTGSWVGLLSSPVVLLGLGIWQLLQDPPAVGAFLALLAFAGLFIGIGLYRMQSLLARGWPGLLAEANRLASGTLYVPAA
jgi:hypothetical protein